MPHPMALLGSISPTHLLSTFGVVGVCIILLIEMGVLVGFFLPGDSLLFIAGYATDQHNSLHIHLPLGWLLVAAAGGAIVGAQVGYEFGRRAGPTLHTRPSSRFYKREYVERADAFLVRFGFARAVVLARFVPVVRTFSCPLAGVAGMSRQSFTWWNVISGVLWVVPIVLLGHAIGHVSFIRKYIEVLAIVAVVVAVVPTLVHMARSRRASD